eukprot:m51a1_g7000 hypothetical protein (573) ;mRNA; f:200532-203037
MATPQPGSPFVVGGPAPRPSASAQGQRFPSPFAFSSPAPFSPAPPPASPTCSPFAQQQQQQTSQSPSWSGLHAPPPTPSRQVLPGPSDAMAVDAGSLPLKTRRMSGDQAVDHAQFQARLLERLRRDPRRLAAANTGRRQSEPPMAMLIEHHASAQPQSAARVVAHFQQQQQQQQAQQAAAFGMPAGAGNYGRGGAASSTAMFSFPAGPGAQSQSPFPFAHRHTVTEGMVAEQVVVPRLNEVEMSAPAPPPVVGIFSSPPSSTSLSPSPIPGSFVFSQAPGTPGSAGSPPMYGATGGFVPSPGMMPLQPPLSPGGQQGQQGPQQVGLPPAQQQGEPRFKLVHEPHELQRKSYKNERRYLLPNPLVVTWVGPQNLEVTGTAEVSLANEAGEEMSPDMQEVLDGSKLKALDEGRRVSFALMMRATSGDIRFRLRVRVRYRVAGSPEDYCDVVLSQPFRVESNRKKNAIEKPKALSIKPGEGSTQGGEEVWIWGAKFGDRLGMRVKFGDVYAAITRAENNILECTAPPRPDLATDTAVPVQIGNVHPQQGVLWATDVLMYTYRTSPSSKKPPEPML